MIQISENSPSGGFFIEILSTHHVSIHLYQGYPCGNEACHLAYQVSGDTLHPPRHRSLGRHRTRTRCIRLPFLVRYTEDNPQIIMSKQQTGGERHWYAIHTYSGYENAVARNLRQRIDSLGMNDKIFNVVVPTEKKIKVKGGKRVEEEEKIYPGYILVDMVVSDESWFVVRNTPRVTGFVGSGVHPVPLLQKEIDTLFGRMGATEVKHTIDLAPEDVVKIADGPFKDLEGRVAEVDDSKGKVKVLVSMFGRETPVELDFLQVKKI